jgi:hypothetical protein
MEVSGRSGGSADLTARRFELEGVVMPERPEMEPLDELGKRANWAGDCDDTDDAVRGGAMVGEATEAPETEE